MYNLILDKTEEGTEHCFYIGQCTHMDRMLFNYHRLRMHISCHNGTDTSPNLLYFMILTFLRSAFHSHIKSNVCVIIGQSRVVLCSRVKAKFNV